MQLAGDGFMSADSGQSFAELAARLYSAETDWLSARAHGVFPQVNARGNMRATRILSLAPTAHP
jgi:hypothetical protein